MAFAEEIDTIKGCYVDYLGEPGDNALRIVIEEGEVGQPTGESPPVADAKPITVAAGCRRFSLYFPSYIAYAARNESYARYAENDVRQERIVQTYSQPAFLDFVSKGTFATNDHRDPFVHHGISTLNHLVDVVACEAPLVHRAIIGEGGDSEELYDWSWVPHEYTF